MGDATSSHKNQCWCRTNNGRLQMIGWQLGSGGLVVLLGEVLTLVYVTLI